MGYTIKAIIETKQVDCFDSLVEVLGHRSNGQMSSFGMHRLGRHVNEGRGLLGGEAKAALNLGCRVMGPLSLHE